MMMMIQKIYMSQMCDTDVMLACEVMEKHIKNQGRVSLARVPACEVMLACEMKSACEVMERQIKNQGRVSLARV